MRKQTLVTNKDSAVPVKEMQALVTNLLPNNCRVETLEGREHIVVPMVILTEGVHNGSSGPIYYAPEELSKTPVAWDHKPIVVYHPEQNGEGITACQPSVINNQKVGIMLNTRFEGKRLRSEAWIEKWRADLVDPRIMAAITSNQMMEVSTGVFIDTEKVDGKWKTEDYVGIARNFRPDHLALLPDQVGACSIKDGAGLLRNTSTTPELGVGMAMSPIAKRRARMSAKKMMKTSVVYNELSFDDIRQDLCNALVQKYPVPGNANTLYSYPYIEDVYSNFFVYSRDGKLFRLGYTSDDTGIKLGSETPVEVYEVTEYRTVADAAPIGNQDQSKTKDEQMNKKEVVDGIITANKGWSEKDRPTLMAMNDEQLVLVTNTVAPKEEKKTEPVVTNVVTAPVTNTAPVIPAVPAKPLTLEEYVAAAPGPVQEVLRNSIQLHAEEKEKLIGVITANANNIFTKEQLNNRPLGELRALARLAAGPTAVSRQADYSGQGPVTTTNNEQEEVLEVPVLNFSKPAPAAK